MRICSISNVTWYHLIIPIYSLLIFCENIIVIFLPPIQKNLVLRIIFKFLGPILGGIIQFIFNIYTKYKIHQKKDDIIADQIESVNAFLAIKLVPDFKKRTFALIIVFIMAFINVLSFYCTLFLTKPNSFVNQLFFGLALMLFIIIFSYLILNIKLYRHHYLSVTLITISMLCFTFSGSISFKGQLYAILFNILFALCEAVTISYCKYVIEEKYIQPLIFFFYYGIVGLGIIFIMCLTCIIGKYDNDYTHPFYIILSSFKLLFESWKYIGLTFTYYVTHTFIIFGTITLIYYDDPLKENITPFFGKIYMLIFMMIMTKITPLYFILVAIGWILVILGLLIHYEILILKCFHLEENTKQAIHLRSQQETQDLLEIGYI